MLHQLGRGKRASKSLPGDLNQRPRQGAAVPFSRSKASGDFLPSPGKPFPVVVWVVVVLLMTTMKKLTRIPVLYPTAYVAELNRAAKADGLSRSSFIVRTMRDAIGQDEVTGKLFKSPSFRSAVAELVTRPDILKHIVGTMGESPEVPAVVRRQVEDQFEQMANPRPKPRQSPRANRKA